MSLSVTIIPPAGLPDVNEEICSMGSEIVRGKIDKNQQKYKKK